MCVCSGNPLRVSRALFVFRELHCVAQQSFSKERSGQHAPMNMSAGCLVTKVRVWFLLVVHGLKKRRPQVRTEALPLGGRGRFVFDFTSFPETSGEVRCEKRHYRELRDRCSVHAGHGEAGDHGQRA